MFSKNTEKLESFVGVNSHFKGDISSKGTLRIDGTTEGNIEADWLVVAEKATIRGNISVRGVIIGGKVEGNVTASEIVEIKPKGHLFGDIVTAKLAISEGGILEGRSTMNKADSKVVELPVKERTG